MLLLLLTAQAKIVSVFRVRDYFVIFCFNNKKILIEDAKHILWEAEAGAVHAMACIFDKLMKIIPKQCHRI